MENYFTSAAVLRPTRLTTPALAGGAREDGVDTWLNKEKPCGERSAALSLSKRRTILPGQGFDRLNLPDWELEIRKAVRGINSFEK
jgi:hypothetical protein